MSHLFVILFLISQSLFAADPVYRTSDVTNSDCRSYILVMLNRLVDGPIHNVKVGPLKDLFKLIIDSGITARQQKQLETVLQIFMGSNVKNEVLTNLLNEITAPENKDAVFVCVLGEGCKLKNQAAAVFTTVSMNSVSYDFANPQTKFSPRIKPYEFDPLHRDALKTYMNAITLSKPDFKSDFEAVNYAGSMLHEMNHFADEKLVSHWLKANQDLIKKGQQPDKLYEKYIKVNKGIIERDSVFFTTFTESRSYEINRHLASAAGKDVSDRVEKLYAGTCLRYLKTKTGDRIIREYQLDESNILDFGIKMGRLMQATIDRAK